MFRRIIRFFFPKVWELLVDYVHEKIKDFKFTLDSLERNLKSLSAKASDVEEQIKNAEQLGKKKRKREVENWLTEVKSIETEFLSLENESESRGFISRFISGGRVAQLNERVYGLVEQSRYFGELLLDVIEIRGEALLTAGQVGKAFGENMERIWRLLITERVSSIGIYGMGGVGKTTLAKHINNQLIGKTKDCVLWVTVSQVFTIKKLQNEIAHLIGVDFLDGENEDKRAARLHQALSIRKNCILILDDVWENINMEKVGYPLSMEGCRLIITTRLIEVCRQMGCNEVIAVKKLHSDEAWNLFSKTLGKEIKLAPQIEEIAKSMAKLCDGLPLGIITLAGSMRGETTLHVWRNALEELKESILGQDGMEKQVFKVLKYSFDRLNTNHQRQGYNSVQLCFLYCSLYPEDYKIGKEEVVRKFISEELMDKRKCRKAQVDQGHSILDKLVNACLLESFERSVKMHDLVRAMALKITEGKTMVIAGDCSLKEIPNDLEKMSLMCSSIKEIPPRMSHNCSKLSTLLLRRNSCLKYLPDSFFSRMRGLCTLDLSYTGITELPNSLSDLESLKALLLEMCRNLVYIPYLGKLKALRELNLTDTSIKEVPQGTEELVNLIFLSLNSDWLNTFPTGWLLKFPYLQYLKLPYHIELPIEELEGLKYLEEICGRVKNICDFNRLIISRQNRMYDTIHKVQVGSCINSALFLRLFYSLDPNLDGLCNQVRLQKCNFRKGEEIDETILAHDIQYLAFDECEGLSNCFLDDFPRLNDPISLETLEINACGGIECILTSEQLMAPEERQFQFSTLEKIMLRGLWDFKGVIHKQEVGATIVALPPPATPARQAAFSSLREMDISHCHKMKKLGLPVSEFPNLERISVSECAEIEEIIEEADDDGRNLCSVWLPKLKWLHLSWLPRLKSICKATMICSSIETITLDKCPTLKKLSFDVVPPSPALKQIKLRKEEREWWESLEWEHSTHSHLLQPFLRFDD